MGVILDSSVVIRAERMRQTELQMLNEIGSLTGFQPLGFAAVGVTEFLHGIYRQKDPRIRQARQQFFQNLLDDIPIYNYTIGTAHLAAQIGGEQAALGFPVPFADLLIGATALELGFSVLTTNLRDFRLIPGLTVLSL